MPSGGKHHGRVNDVSRSGSAAQHSSGTCDGIGQWFHDDPASVEEPGQSCLTPAISPHLADHTRRHKHAPVLLPGHLDDSRRVTVFALHSDQRSSVEDEAQRCSASANRCRA